MCRVYSFDPYRTFAYTEHILIHLGKVRMGSSGRSPRRDWLG